MNHPLDRPVWSCLTGAQANLARGGDAAVRIDPAYGIFGAARDQGGEAMIALAGLIDEPTLLVETEAWTAPPGVAVERTVELAQMVAERECAGRPSKADIVPLREDDAAAMRELVAATEPGPWSTETHRYGQFYGVRDGDKLVAMAGERMRPDGFAEVSGVCTDSAYRGRGYATALMLRVMHGFRARGLTPFLHAYTSNAGALALYESLGFRLRRVMIGTVLVPADA